MYRPNFCGECGARLARKGWRVWLHGSVCDTCACRLGKSIWTKSLIVGVMIAFVAFAFGRYLRPAPPPLIIQRVANSPLSDLPENPNDSASATTQKHIDLSRQDAAPATVSTDDAVYICGAGTKKGTPCHRRVHFAGERCFQHKGMPAILPLDKLVIKQ